MTNYALFSFFFIPLLGFGTKWYKGNTHVHTTLCGHADSTPDFVAQWYHDRGYNFWCSVSIINLLIHPQLT